MRKWGALVIGGALLITLATPVNAAAPKAGATCTKKNATATSGGKLYTCILSGKKLVWNKGVARPKPVPVVTPSPTSTPTPSPSPTSPSNQSTDLQNMPCNKEGDVFSTAVGSFRCEKRSDTGLTLWNKLESTPTASPTTTTTAKNSEGLPCQKLGDRYSNTMGFLECRYVKGKKLQWVQLSNSAPIFQNPISPQDVSKCKLKGDYRGNAVSGFVPDVTLMGLGNVYPRINPAVGFNSGIIVPVDFPDFTGDKDLDSLIKSNKDSYLEWIKYFSGGKLKPRMDSINSWLRMPQATSFYKLSSHEGDNDLRNGQKGTTRLAQYYFDEITKVVDLTQYRSIFLIFPSNPQPGVLSEDLPPRMVEFQLKEGKREMSLFAGIGGGYDYSVRTPPWAIWIHEMAHDWGLDGHAPGNGWNIGIMTNQGGVSLALNAWDRFLLTWMPDELVFCETKDTLQTTSIKLSALERDDSQTKMVAVALDNHRLLVVEAHGIGKWFSRRPEQASVFKINFGDTGLYYLLAYIVDTKFIYPAQTIVNSDGSALQIDDGVNPNIPRHAYLQKVLGETGSNDYRLIPGSEKDYGAYLAVQGDSFSIEGINIEFISTGDYETIKISKG